MSVTDRELLALAQQTWDSLAREVEEEGREGREVAWRLEREGRYRVESRDREGRRVYRGRCTVDIPQLEMVGSL